MSHIIDNDDNLPDVGNGDVPCCMGSAVYGPGRCTCWVTEYDQPQAPQVEGPMRVRDRMCADCAFRPGSPERSGDQRYAHSDEDGLEDALRGEFACHQGMHRRVRLVHPSGAVLELGEMCYAPPNPNRPARADGTPAELCAGWAAARRTA